MMKIDSIDGLADCLIISGRLRHHEDFLEFKSQLHARLQNHDKTKPICLFLRNTPIELYFIGYLLKLKDNDGWDIRVHTNDVKVFKAFEDLALGEKFEIQIKEA